MLTLAGTSWPLDRAAAHLKEFCHVQTSDDTIERVCQEQGERARRWMEPSNEPTVRLANCAIAPAHRIGAGWKRLSQRMGLEQSDQLSVIADGARWIWEQADKRFSKRARWCVDVYHVSQHLHDCGKSLFGEGERARDWANQRLMHALEHNGVQLIERLEREREQLTPSQRPTLDRVLGYLRDNRDSLWYHNRLQQGLLIGSGLIEGACKNTLGSGLKANSAR